MLAEAIGTCRGLWCMIQWGPGAGRQGCRRSQVERSKKESDTEGYSLMLSDKGI